MSPSQLTRKLRTMKLDSASLALGKFHSKKTITLITMIAGIVKDLAVRGGDVFVMALMFGDLEIDVKVVADECRPRSLDLLARLVPPLLKRFFAMPELQR